MSASTTGAQRATIALLAALGLATVTAAAVRVAPLIEGGERLQRQCVSEDGYLMLTIARNIALGRGFSVSDGMIPTNGTQPLSTLLYALCFKCTGADKLKGLYPVVGSQVLVSILAAVLLFIFTRKYLYRGAHATVVALVAASVWFASPTSIMSTQNSLETGLYSLLLLLSVVSYDALAPRFRRALDLRACALLGLVLGLTFLARHDACFLIAVMLAVHLLIAYRRALFPRAFAQVFLIGSASVLVALPWIWFNVARFGHPVPVSGRAEALGVAFAHNLAPAFAALLENVSLVLRIPSALQGQFSVQAGSALLLASIAVAALWWRHWLAERFSAGMGVLACFAGALFVYYSLFFGMPSFLGRYFFPAVMLAAVVGAAVATAVVVQLRRPDTRIISVVTVLLAAVLCAGLDARVYLKGRQHLHSQVVDWVAANVPDDAWVAAVQTGTLGYYHDRTINLDGKVDPHAFSARKHGRTPDYLIERNVAYIVDWSGIAKWARLPAFAVNYKLILNDPDRNLVVLRKRPTRLLSANSAT